MRMKAFFASLLFAATLLLLSRMTYAQQDITPPALLDVTFEPAVIDAGSGPVTITVTVHVTDDLSGVEYAIFYFRQPATTQQAYVELRPNSSWTTHIEGDVRDGRYAATMAIRQYAAYGFWEMSSVYLSDVVGNYISYFKPEPGQPPNGWPEHFNKLGFTVTELPDAPPTSTPTPTPTSTPEPTSAPTPVPTGEPTPGPISSPLGRDIFLPLTAR